MAGSKFVYSIRKLNADSDQLKLELDNRIRRIDKDMELVRKDLAVLLRSKPHKSTSAGDIFLRQPQDNEYADMHVNHIVKEARINVRNVRSRMDQNDREIQRIEQQTRMPYGSRFGAKSAMPILRSSPAVSNLKLEKRRPKRVRYNSLPSDKELEFHPLPSYIILQKEKPQENKSVKICNT